MSEEGSLTYMRDIASCLVLYLTIDHRTLMIDID